MGGFVSLDNCKKSPTRYILHIDVFCLELFRQCRLEGTRRDAGGIGNAGSLDVGFSCTTHGSKLMRIRLIHCSQGMDVVSSPNSDEALHRKVGYWVSIL